VSAQQWWIQTGGDVIGPVSSSRLKELAAQGNVAADTFVSIDNIKWVRASKIRGLLGPSSKQSNQVEEQAELRATSPTDSLPRASNNTGKEEQASRTTQSTLLCLNIPLLRVSAGIWKTDVIAIYDSHILKGTRYLRQLSVTEDMCLSSGERALAAQFHRTQTITFADVSHVSEYCPSESQSRQHQLGTHRFDMRAADGTFMNFSIPASQVAHVRALLQLRVTDRYRLQRSYRGWEWPSVRRALGLLFASLLLFGGLITVSVGLAAFAFGNILIGTTACIAAIALSGAAGYLLFNRRRVWVGWDSACRTNHEASVDLKQKPRTAPSKAKSPFRSIWLGWALKTAGVCYWIAIASPLTDDVSAYLDEHLKNQQYNIQLAWTLIWAPAPVLIYAGYRLCQKQYPLGRASDTRRPIVFLRPFDDDASTSLQPPGFLASIAGVRTKWRPYQWSSARNDTGRISVGDFLLDCHPVRLLRMVFDRDVATSEESIVRVFEGFGPVVTIGKPGEGLATPGALRAYTADNEWQEVVLKLLHNAQTIVMQPGRTLGVRWELEQVRRYAEPHRVLLCLAGFWRDPQAYEELSRLCKEAAKIELPRVVPFMNSPVFMYFDREWRPEVQAVSYKTPVLWPLTVDALDLPFTLQPFLQGMHGGEREPPRKPRWSEGIGTALVSFVAVFFSIVVMIAPVIAINAIGQRIIPALMASLGVRGPGHTGNEAQHALRRIVTTSPRVTLHGRAVPYTFVIPEALAKIKSQEPTIEHYYRSPDRKLSVQVIASTIRGDVSTLAEERLEQNKNDQVAELKLESVRNVTVGGADWIESRIVARLANGVPIRETSRGCSNENGTVFVIVHHVMDDDSDYLHLVEEILSSFRLGSAH
jgi:hypothetical protein